MKIIIYVICGWRSMYEKGWLSERIFRKDGVDNDAKLLHFYENVSDQFVKHGN